MKSLSLLVLLALVVGLSQTVVVAEDNQDDGTRKLVESLKGDWQMTSRTQGGAASDEDFVKNRTATFEGNSYSLYDKGVLFASIKYTVDWAKTPAWLDITFRDGSQDKAIIKLDGDALTMCFGNGGDRPDDFQTKAGDRRILAVYQRLKK